MEFEHNGQQYIVDYGNTKDIRATSKDGSVLELARPEIFGATVNDIYMITSINGFLCYVFNIEGRLSTKPALREFVETKEESE